MSEEYEVESILKHRITSNLLYYLVKWKGFGVGDATWEPEENLSSCEEILKNYKKKNGLTESRKSYKLHNSNIAEIIDIVDGSTYESGIIYKIRCVGDYKYTKARSEDIQSCNIQLLIDFLESKLPI